MAEPSCTFLYILVGMIEGNRLIQLEIQKKKNFFYKKINSYSKWVVSAVSPGFVCVADFKSASIICIALYETERVILEKATYLGKKMKGM